MFLLDSSAWLAHLFGEPGVEQVNQLFDDSQVEVAISVLSIPEIYTYLKSLNAEEHWQDVWHRYNLLFSKTIPVEASIAHQAIVLRDAAKARLPTIDGLIAATASVHNLTLIHRDPHFASIPTDKLIQVQLPDK